MWIAANLMSRNSWKYSGRNDKSVWSERLSFSLISVCIEKDASCQFCLILILFFYRRILCLQIVVEILDYRSGRKFKELWSPFLLSQAKSGTDNCAE